MGSPRRQGTRILPHNPLARGAAVAGAVVIGVLVALTIVLQLVYAGRIYPGVRVMGVDLSGLQPPEAQQLLQSQFDRYAQSKLPLRYASSVWQVAPSTLGLEFDAAQTVDTSFNVGRRGNPLSRVVEQVRLLSTGREIAPSLKLEEERIIKTLSSINDEVRKQPANAALEFRADGTVAIVASRPGQEIAVDAAASHIQQSLLKLSTEPIVLPERTVPVALPEGALAEARERAQALVERPLTLRYGEKDWTYLPSDLSQWVLVQDVNGAIQVDWDEAKLTAALKSISDTIDARPVDAQLALDGAEVRFTPSHDGTQLDIQASLAAVRNGVDASNRTIDLVTHVQAPRVTTETLEPARQRLATIVSGPLELADDERRSTIGVDELASLVQVDVVTSPEPRGEVVIDRDGLIELVKDAAVNFDYPARNARFRFVGGKLEVTQREVSGRKVDVESTVDRLLAAVTGESRVVTPVFVVIQPSVTAAAAQEIVANDLIMSASTSYAGSIAERAHNVELAAQRLNGAAIPPGEVFSFNDTLGPATLKSGFQIGYGITLTGSGDVQTIPSEAGGICQVATTLFHAVFWSGYEVVERNWHLYWIPRYGQAPRGLKGLDATVDDQYGVDFRFKNNTPNWIIIGASADGQNLTFSLYGVKPDWQVQVGQPVITNIVKANQAMVYQTDPSFAPGRQLLVEHAEDGFDAAITRTVTRDGAVVDQWTARANYRPARNVMLVGPSVATPAPAASPSPTPAGSPEQSPTPAPH